MPSKKFKPLWLTDLEEDNLVKLIISPDRSTSLFGVQWITTNCDVNKLSISQYNSIVNIVNKIKKEQSRKYYAHTEVLFRIAQRSYNSQHKKYKNRWVNLYEGKNKQT